MGTILPCFQMLRTVLCRMEKLKISVKAMMATGPRCFKCLYVMPLGPVAEVYLACSIASLVTFGVKGSGGLLLGRCC